MCSSELFCLASASANDKAWKACSEPSLACRILPNITPSRSFDLARNAAQLRWLRVGRRLRFRPGLGQQVARQIEGVGDDGGNDRARDYGGDQRRVLALVDDPARQAEQG